MCRQVLAFLLALLFFVNLLSCDADPKTSLPIEKESLVKVLSDIHIIEGALQNQKSSDKDSLANTFYNQIYEKHDISEADFVSTLELMEEDPKLLQQIYEQVLIELDSIEKQSYKSKYKKK